MRDVDLTGFATLDPGILGHRHNLRRVKLTQTHSILATDGVDFVAEEGSSSARCDSLTLLDSPNIAGILSWASGTPGFGRLRELRVGFHPRTDTPHVEAFLRHSRKTLEVLHLQLRKRTRPFLAPAAYLNKLSRRLAHPDKYC